ncbi:MAG: hypothetical protein QOF20_1933, partial [Acidimicrobiaceae bacterium]|nr:hypothetical protein [Acidimicrobiaceae bacterium]
MPADADLASLASLEAAVVAADDVIGRAAAHLAAQGAGAVDA